MPLLDDIAGYNIVKVPVVFDIGSAYTKCGFAGDFSPRCIVTSSVTDPSTGKEMKIREIADETELYESLKQLLLNLYFRHCLVGAKDRRVVICESVLCSTLIRRTLAKLLLRHFEVLSVMFAPHHMLSLLPLAASTGLVIDVGYTECLVLPVYEGITIMKALQMAPIASKAIHRSLQTLLREHSTSSTGKPTTQSLSDIIEHLDEKIFEDIKVRCCFVTNFARGKKIQEALRTGNVEDILDPPPDMTYPIGRNMVLTIPGEVREQACEVLFQHKTDEATVATLILDSLLRCPLDCRKALVENVVVTGGTARIPGFHHRLTAELYSLLDEAKYKRHLVVKTFRFHRLPAKENYLSWLGGSIFADLETLPSRSVSRENYVENDTLADWCRVSEKFDDLNVKDH